MGITKFVAALLVATCLAGPAIAASNSSSTSNATGTGTANNAGIGNSGALSNSYSGSASTSTGGAGQATGSSVVNFTYNDPTTGTSTGGDPLIKEQLVTTGAAIAPSIYNNNLCALGASAGAGWLGGAFAIGFDRVDKGCDTRATAALLGHFAEINSIAAAHAADPAIRARAYEAAIIYAQWANNYLCMSNPDLAAAMPPGSNFCKTVATQTGLQVVPAPVAVAAPPKLVQTAIADPPPSKPVYTGPHVYGTYEVVPSSYRSGPVSGYNGPDYDDKGVKD